MSKIICDVCGTKYPDSAEQCPICGRVASGGAKTVADSFVMDEAQVESRPKVRGGRFSKSNVRKRNKNMSYEEDYEDKNEEEPIGDEYEYEDEEPSGKSGVVLNVLLVIVIIALLCVTGYIFMEFFLPNVLPGETIPETTVSQETEATVVETEEPTIPCENLILNEDYSEELAVGGYTLLNVEVYPEDTTDALTFASSDESVVTVNSEGRVTAVGEGEAVVTITCGEKTQEIIVSCYAEEAEETEVPLEGEEETEAPAEEPEETEGPTEPLKDVTLKVNLTDMTFNAKGQGYTFKVEGLDNTEVQWISQDESVVTIDENGKAISVGKGKTTIICKYGDQEVEIIIRCNFG